MRLITNHHRAPGSWFDPIDGHEAGLIAVATAMSRPARHETIVVMLDDAHRGIAGVVVTDTVAPDSVVDVVECLVQPQLHAGRVAAIVVGSVRPGGGVDDTDVDRWLELSAIAGDHGVELLEWFVFGGAGGGAVVRCPRDLLGEAPRW